VDQAEHGEDPEHLQQLAPIDHVFALGDCCARMDLALPALAQVRRVLGLGLESKPSMLMGFRATPKVDLLG
jgi:pyruvate/2-oxoglutarate dehydrogenase complex dihydrolipoamide dehydrogenase (E3) component